MPSRAMPFYRFFCPFRTNSPHGSPSFFLYRSEFASVPASGVEPWSREKTTLEARLSFPAARLPPCPPSLDLARSRRHLRRSAHPAACGLLLRLRRIPRPRRLRQNVRTKKICGALVGHLLRQAPRPQPRQQFRHRSTPPSPRSRRTRPALNLPNQSKPPQPLVGAQHAAPQLAQA